MKGKELREVIKKKNEKKKEDVKKKEELGVSFLNMEEEAMRELLIELRGTAYWQAILKLNRSFHNPIVDGLFLLDPTKDSTQMARLQGRDVGIFLLECEVNKYHEEKKNKEKELEENK